MIRYITARSRSREEFIDITADVREAVRGSQVGNGICHLFMLHTTAGITINEGADPAVQRDIQQVLSRLVPKDIHYLHAEGNSDAHIKSALVGTSQSVFIEDGRLLLGTWQAIYFCEFDGPRQRRIAVSIVPVA